MRRHKDLAELEQTVHAAKALSSLGLGLIRGLQADQVRSTQGSCLIPLS